MGIRNTCIQNWYKQMMSLPKIDGKNDENSRNPPIEESTWPVTGIQETWENAADILYRHPKLM